MHYSRLIDIEAKLAHCQTLLDQLMACIENSDNLEELTGLDYSKIFATISFTLCSLHYVNLKLTGKDPAADKITQELLRVKGHMHEINEILASPSRRQLDRAAAGRIIRSLI